MPAGMKPWIALDERGIHWTPFMLDMLGLAYYGVVTAIPGANQFTIAALAGRGAGKFDGATNPYRAFVLRDALGTGAAPQGEHNPITAYVTATGTFTAAGFGGGGVAVGDEILILHPAIAGSFIIITGLGRQLFSMDFWSDMMEEVAVTGAQSTIALPTVTVANLPAGAAIVRAVAMFKFRMVENTNIAANKLDAAAALPMQVDDSVATGYITAIDFIDDAFSLAASTREGGEVIIGDNNIAARVDANDVYSVRWLNAKADLANLQFNDVQVGLRIWYSV